MLPSIFRVYLLSRSAVSVELHDGATAWDVCVQIKRRLDVVNDADYGLFGGCYAVCALPSLPSPYVGVLT
jgi:hypothetical protein